MVTGHTENSSVCSFCGGAGEVTPSSGNGKCDFQLPCPFCRGTGKVAPEAVTDDPVTGEQP